MKKYMKFIITFFSLILFTTGAGILISKISTETNTQDTSQQAPAKSDVPYVKIDSNGIKEHPGTWDTFVQDSENGIATSIQLDYEYPGQIPYGAGASGAAVNLISLQFDGENYLCLGKKYKYLLELTGRTANAAKSTTYVILSDKPYSFMDISNSIYSSSSNDQIPYMLLFTR